jgi:hypothetical protein
MTKKKIDNEVFLRFLTRLIFQPIYTADKILLFWKVTETPSYRDWYNVSKEEPTGEFDESGNPIMRKRVGKVVKLKKSGFEQTYRKGSIIRVVFVAVIYMNYLLFF